MTMPDGTVPGGVRGVMKALKRRLSDSHGRRPTVGLVGYFGWGNYGDELFVQVWQQVLLVCLWKRIPTPTKHGQTGRTQCL